MILPIDSDSCSMKQSIEACQIAIKDLAQEVKLVRGQNEALIEENIKLRNTVKAMIPILNEMVAE